MKRILSLILSAVLCVALAACNNNQAVNIEGNDENPPSLPRQRLRQRGQAHRRNLTNPPALLMNCITRILPRLKT